MPCAPLFSGCVSMVSCTLETVATCTALRPSPGTAKTLETLRLVLVLGQA